jgi:hypothetical protein
MGACANEKTMHEMENEKAWKLVRTKSGKKLTQDYEEKKVVN